jgi:hypothetical protein
MHAMQASAVAINIGQTDTLGGKEQKLSAEKQVGG